MKSSDTRRNSPKRWAPIVLLAIPIASGCSSSTSARSIPVMPTHPSAVATPLLVSPLAPTAVPPVTSVAEVAFATRSLGWAVGLRCRGSGASGSCATLESSTADGGKTWSGAVVVAQPHYSEDSLPRVHVRFRGLDGWVFGPGIYGTHNGGRTWRLQDDRPTLSLEPAGTSVWAVTGFIRAQLCQPRLSASTAAQITG